MILKPACKIRDAALAVPSHIRHLPNVVVHVAGGENEHNDDAERGPEVAVLHDRHHIGPRDGGEGQDTEDGGRHDDDAGVVDRTDEAGVR